MRVIAISGNLTDGDCAYSSIPPHPVPPSEPLIMSSPRPSTRRTGRISFRFARLVYPIVLPAYAARTYAQRE